MGTVMIYNSVATKEVKPDVVGLMIRLNAKCKTAKEAADKINEDRNLAKTFITGRTSYRADSYHQTDFNLRKQTYRETYYVRKDNNKTEISEEEWKNLSQVNRNEYVRSTREHFLYYEANLSLVAVLNYSDTVVNDLMSIFNMCTEKDFKCDYEHAISDELEDATMQELYTKCINQGVFAVQNIVNKLKFITSKEVKLLEVRDPAAVSTPTRYDGAVMRKSAMCMDEAYLGASAYEPEQIITPELLEELFNNNIELKKSLDLTLEF